MRKFTVPAALLVLGATCFSSTIVLADEGSAVQQRFREQGKGLDLTGFFKSENDARSRSFMFGSPHAHDFTVKSAGVYRFESKVSPGYADNYRIEAMLMDAQGRVIARDEGNGNSGGLKLEQPLEPGDYTLQVQADRFGTRGKAGDGYSIAIVGLDDQGNEVQGGVSDGEGIQFVGTDRDGNSNAFVHGDTVATLGSGTAAGGATAGSTTASSAATTGMSAGTGASTVATTTSSGTGVSSGAAVAGGVAVGTAAGVAAASSRTDVAAEAAPQAPVTSNQAAAPAAGAASDQVQSITTDVKIRARGEFLTFDVAEPSQVVITTSTYPAGDEETYRLVLEVVDESGQVLAEGAGKAGNGNVEIRTQLAPGRYKIQGFGQKFGGAHSGPNNYELKVVLDQ